MARTEWSKIGASVAVFTRVNFPSDPSSDNPVTWDEVGKTWDQDGAYWDAIVTPVGWVSSLTIADANWMNEGNSDTGIWSELYIPTEPVWSNN